MSLDALPAISDLALPQEVRDGTAGDKKAYKAALGFERMLLHQLAEQMAEAASATGSEGDDKPAGAGAYQGMLADSMADSLVSGGGMGLAKQIYSNVKREPTL